MKVKKVIIFILSLFLFSCGNSTDSLSSEIHLNETTASSVSESIVSEEESLSSEESTLSSEEISSEKSSESSSQTELFSSDSSSEGGTDFPWVH